MNLSNITHCPRCRKPLVAAKAIGGGESTSFKECPACGTLINTYRPTTYQAAFLRSRHRYKLCAGGYGCSPAGSKVLLFNGSLKNVEDVVIGDVLMGPDNKPRNVIRLHRGSTTMVNVETRQDRFTVTEHHAFHLEYWRQRRVADCTRPQTLIDTFVMTPLQLSNLKPRTRSQMYLRYSDPIEFPERVHYIDPYLLGLLIGGGTLNNSTVKITTSDKEIKEYVYNIKDQYNMYITEKIKDHSINLNTVDLRMCSFEKSTKVKQEPFRTELARLGLWNSRARDKFIPEEYLTSSIHVRMKMLAGLIDTDGCNHYNNYRIDTVSDQLAVDIQRLARSLGFRTSLYTRVRPNTTGHTITIFGHGLQDIPIKVKRKQSFSVPQASHNHKHVSFSYTYTDVQPYFGFELDGDNLYIDGETFMVHHNSGKSRSNIEDVIKHLLLIPNARVVVAARTYPALDSTFIKEFYSMFPEKLVRRKNEQKKEITLTNNSELIFRSFDDPTKLKSMNVTKAVIVEASDVPYSGFTMLQSRLRNTAAMIPEFDMRGNPVKHYDNGEWKTKYAYDARSINLETNPDSGWVKSFLLDSGTVEFYGDAYNEGYRFKDDRDNEKYTQVVSTNANPFLPPNYEKEQTRGKSEAYIQQFYKGSFNFSDNLVFPNFGTVIVRPKKLPREFDEMGRRVLYYLIGMDYGINDPTHAIFAAYSTETRKMYVFGEMRINNSDIKTIAKEYRKCIREYGVNLDGLLMLPKFDGRSYNKRESDLRTIGSMFEDEGLYFSPSFASHEARIIKTNSLINHEQIEVFSTCEFLVEEMLNYKYKLDRNGQPTDKPVDGNDHGITALEFITVELPNNLQELRLSVYLPQGTRHEHDRRQEIKVKQQVYDPLKEEEEKHGTGYINNPYFSSATPDHTYGIVGETLEDEGGEDRGDGFGDYYIPK